MPGLWQRTASLVSPHIQSGEGGLPDRSDSQAQSGLHTHSAAPPPALPFPALRPDFPNILQSAPRISPLAYIPSPAPVTWLSPEASPPGTDSKDFLISDLAYGFSRRLVHLSLLFYELQVKENTAKSSLLTSTLSDKVCCTSPLNIPHNTLAQSPLRSYPAKAACCLSFSQTCGYAASAHA